MERKIFKIDDADMIVAPSEIEAREWYAKEFEVAIDTLDVDEVLPSSWDEVKIADFDAEEGLDLVLTLRQLVEKVVGLEGEYCIGVIATSAV